ncbi:hypothetical protein [Shimia biformata]|uniref:hypothetical protein n=1 Tax=Shimia biformata TaxID=1294299 RepID=UPI00195261F3|nr:hypothetical protein [Shimia biformata]
MRKTGLALLVVATLGGCGFSQSNWNPFNWFGSSEEVEVIDENTNPLVPQKSNTGMFAKKPPPPYPGVPVGQVKELRIERVKGGALIRVTGVSDYLGSHSVKLQPENDGVPIQGVLTYQLLAINPGTPAGGGSEIAREVTVAHSLTNQQLEGVRTIKVVGARNALQSRR